MILCEQYNAATNTVEQLQLDQIPERLKQKDVLLWLDVARPEAKELTWLIDTFGFHPLAIDDVRNQRQRAKVDKYDSYFFVVLRSIHYHPASHRVDSRQIDIFIGENFLVTIHKEEEPALEEARSRWKESNLFWEHPSYLFYMAADFIIDNYFPVIDKIGDEIDDLDKEILSNPSKSSIANIFTLRRSLLAIRKTLAPLRDAFNELIRSEEGGTIFPIEKTRVYFSDVFDHILRLTDFVDTYRDMLSGSIDAYQSSLSNRLNENMQRLTVAATILATSAVITGFFGMNVQGMLINSSWRYGGLTVLLILVVIILFEIWIFRKKGWL